MYIADDPLLALIARFTGEARNLEISDGEFLLMFIKNLIRYIEMRFHPRLKSPILPRHQVRPLSSWRNTRMIKNTLTEAVQATFHAEASLPGAAVLAPLSEGIPPPPAPDSPACGSGVPKD